VFNKEKALVAGQVGNVVGITGQQVVHSNDIMTFSQQAITEVTTQKTGAASN
jgi:hypothetical protein